MSLLILRRFRPAPPLALVRFGPDASLPALAERSPAAALPAVIGPPGPGEADLTGQFGFGDATPDLIDAVEGWMTRGS